jgi:hypothetical protein
MSVDLQVCQDHVLRGGVVPGIAGGRLIVPDKVAVIRPQGQDCGQIEIVTAAGAAGLTAPRGAIADAHLQQVELGVKRQGIPDRPTAANDPPLAAVPGRGRPGHGGILEGLRRIPRHGIKPPEECSRLRVIGRDVAAHAEFRAAVADDDFKSRPIWAAGLMSRIRLQDSPAWRVVARLHRCGPTPLSRAALRIAHRSGFSERSFKRYRFSCASGSSSTSSGTRTRTTIL